ncbi:MAG TPA: hypothetical protein HA356_04490, partial [Candidatus Poseidoniaceae archaeon]
MRLPLLAHRDLAQLYANRMPLRGGHLALNMSAEQMWIAGEWCDAEDGATADILNPATSEVMATTP